MILRRWREKRRQKREDYDKTLRLIAEQQRRIDAERKSTGRDKLFWS